MAARKHRKPKAHDESALKSECPTPSRETETPWLDVHSEEFLQALANGRVSEMPRSGKWLLFVKRDDVDEVWAKIAAATRGGRLGHAAKVSTAWENPLSTNRGKHVICVYTRDHEDVEDVRRVRAALRELGFVHPIAYKTDDATLEGRYQVKGDKRIAKYWE